MKTMYEPQNLQDFVDERFYKGIDELTKKTDELFLKENKTREDFKMLMRNVFLEFVALNIVNEED